MNQIPFNRPFLSGKEFTYLRQALEQGYISGNGAFTRRCQELLERELRGTKVLLTTSCTHALELAALLLELGPGDEVIVPSLTFVSTANAFVMRGARPVFVDSRRDTFNLDETLIEAAITPKTRAIVAMHYGGVGCEMEAIVDTARRHRLALLEDNAHGLFAQYRGQALGTFGAMAALSFHETKNFHCGEGGALILNDKHYLARAEVLREKGTNRAAFFRGEVDKYTWVDVGSNYLLSDALAAFLYAQLEVRGRIQAKRKKVWETYHVQLRDWAAEEGVMLPFIPSHCRPSCHIFQLLLPTMEIRDALIRFLRGNGIHAVFHYQPLHDSAMGRRFGAKPGDCPVAEDVSRRLVRLPFYNGMTEQEQQTVIRSVRQFPVRRTPLSAVISL